MPVTILTRANIKKEQNLRPLKNRTEYLLRLNLQSSEYEFGFLLYHGDYIKCNNYLSYWLDAYRLKRAKAKNSEEIQNNKRKLEEGDDLNEIKKRK